MAQDNARYAPGIVRLLEDYIKKIPDRLHLPVLYVIDSICKNVGDPYAELFSRNIVNIFVSIVNRSSQDASKLEALHELRRTWSNVFSATILADMDAKLLKLRERRMIQQQMKIDKLVKQLAAKRLARQQSASNKRQRSETVSDSDESRFKRRKS